MGQNYFDLHSFELNYWIMKFRIWWERRYRIYFYNNWAFLLNHSYQNSYKNKLIVVQGIGNEIDSGSRGTDDYGSINDLNTGGQISQLTPSQVILQCLGISNHTSKNSILLSVIDIL